MNETTITKLEDKLTVGLDVGDRYTQMCVLDEVGEGAAFDLLVQSGQEKWKFQTGGICVRQRPGRLRRCGHISARHLVQIWVID